MSFLDRIKDTARPPVAPAASPGHPFDELAPPANPMESTQRLGQSTLSPELGRLDGDASIISEAAPSELAGDFADSRMPGMGTEQEAFSSGLPLIGAWPLLRQQRGLVILFGAGLLGLLATGVLALNSSGRSADQVGAAGQASTQSQRLAKSVSQALVGNAAAFPEVKESIGILARNVRSLKSGEGDVAADRKSTRLNSSHLRLSRMPSSA